MDTLLRARLGVHNGAKSWANGAVVEDERRSVEELAFQFGCGCGGKCRIS
jgi:hypothetical protein